MSASCANVIFDSAGSEDETSIDGAVAVERLQHLRDQRSGAEESDSEDKEKHARDGEVTIAEQAEVDHRLLDVQLPKHGGNPSKHSSDDHQGDKTAAEPIVDLTTVEGNLKRAAKDMLERVHWNRAKAARLLQISYKALLYKIVDCGLATPARDKDDVAPEEVGAAA